LAVEGKTEMRLHFLHIAKFVALVALAVVITHTLGSRTQDSHRRARPMVQFAHPALRFVGAHETLSMRIRGDVATIESAAATPKEDTLRNTEATQPLTAGDEAAPIVAASADGGIISNLAEELKSTITLLRAYSQWIRTSPDSMS
jgi:hypothetical protein